MKLRGPDKELHGARALKHFLETDASLLVETSFRHENRVSNSETHRLARFAVSSSIGRQVWFLQPPDGLCNPNNVLVQ